MRRDHFDKIMKYLHAAGNNGLNPQDKYSKFHPLLSMLDYHFMSFGATLGAKDTSIDELMIPYYGRHPNKQFIPGKLIWWGYKAWVSASPLGYVYFTDVYQGRKTSDGTEDEY